MAALLKLIHHLTAKKLHLIFRGEIFVTSVDGGITKRITNTPFQERSVTFSPDGRSLYYAAEHEGTGWDIMKTSIARKEEPYFFTSTILNTQPVVATDKDGISTRGFSRWKRNRLPRRKKYSKGF